MRTLLWIACAAFMALLGPSSSQAIELENDTLTLKGEATVWTDVTITGSRALSGPGSPAWSTIDAGTVNAWSLGVGDGLDIDVQMPHLIEEDSTIEVHVHAGPDGTDGDGGNAEFTFNCAWADTGDAFDTIYALTSADCAMGTGTDTNVYCDVGEYTNATHGVNDTPSTLGICQVTRTAATADEYTGDVWFWAIDFHIETDKLGSNTETAW